MSMQADEEEQLPAPAAAIEAPQLFSYRRAGDRQTFVTLRRMPAVEAQMAAAKLDAEGITAFVAGQHLAGAHPIFFSEVQLQVLHEDLARAAQVLDQPAVRAPARDDDDYADEESAVRAAIAKRWTWSRSPPAGESSAGLTSHCFSRPLCSVY